MAAASEVKCPPDETNSHVSGNETFHIKLIDLKVVDLKAELEKRDLDRNGIKSVLLERLKKALSDEGEDPDEYTFTVTSDSATSKSPHAKKKKIVSSSASDVEKVCNNEEKNNDITLQLSIDEEEAQLNEDENIETSTENIEVSKTDGNETAPIKIDEICDQLNSDITSEKENVASTEEISKQVTPPKPSKLMNDTSKDKKASKTGAQLKGSDVCCSVSPKVLKVIGKNDKMKSPNILAKSLWVTGLLNSTRAADLKAVFSKQGRVLSVKIVKSAKQIPGKCYGFVTMATNKDASKAIQNLHRTELNGRIISVEKTQSEPSTLLKKSESKLLAVAGKKQTLKKENAVPKLSDTLKVSSTAESKQSAKPDSKNIASAKNTQEESVKHKDEKSASSEKTKSKEKDRRSREHEKDSRRSFGKTSGFRPRSFGFNDRPRYTSFRRPFGRKPFAGRSAFGSSSFRPRANLLVYNKMREERLRQRENFMLRERREAERRRADEISRHKYIERKQREEAYRLEREKEKLRLEREVLDRERSVLLKLERETQRLERERLEHEKEELRRQAELRRGSKRPFNRVEREADTFWEDRKKSRFEGRTTFHSEGSSSSRYEFPARERTSFNRHEFERYSNQKSLDPSRPDYGDRDARREVSIRSREERQVFNRSNYRDRDHRRSFPSRERERHSSRREQSRDDWKHDRRVHERVVTPNGNSGQRRMTYF